jgi:hypothetical protein
MGILLEIFAIIAVDFLLFLMIAGLREESLDEFPRRLARASKAIPPGDRPSTRGVRL